MINNFSPYLLTIILITGTVNFASADPRHQNKLSKLDSDPDVVYTAEFTEDSVQLLVVKPAVVFSSKNGGRKRGSLKIDSKVELIGFTDRAYKIRGKLENGRGVSGWVTPKALASKDKNFVENLKQLFARQIKVRELIENKQVALGMTPDEVTRIHGEPTKSKVRRTDKGQTSTWEFIEYEEQKHYVNIRDPYTGNFYRRYSHTTKEEVSKILVEFENDIATAIEESQNNGKRRTISIPAPIALRW